MNNRSWPRQLLTLLRKDLRIDWHSRSRGISIIAFALVILFLFAFAGEPATAQIHTFASGYLWLALLFASVLALGESYRTELADDALTTLMLVPVDPKALFLGKALANALLLLVVAVILLPFLTVLFAVPFNGSIWHLFCFLGLGILGLAAPGTLYAAMTARVRGQDVMLPLLLFPLIVPVLVAAVKGTALAIGGDPMAQTSGWMTLLVCFNLVYWMVCPLLFSRVIEQ